MSVVRRSAATVRSGFCRQVLVCGGKFEEARGNSVALK